MSILLAKAVASSVVITAKFLPSSYFPIGKLWLKWSLSALGPATGSSKSSTYSWWWLKASIKQPQNWGLRRGMPGGTWLWDPRYSNTGGMGTDILTATLVTEWEVWVLFGSWGSCLTPQHSLVMLVKICKFLMLVKSRQLRQNQSLHGSWASAQSAGMNSQPLVSRPWVEISLLLQ